MRTNIIPRLSLQFAVFQQDFKSELVYNPDSGQDEAGAPSRRQGIEISGQYHPFLWLELNAGEAEPIDHGYSEFNLDIGYALPHRWKLGVGLFNLFNSRDEAADYYYAGRLRGEPAEGVTDFQVHPLEPRSARVSLTKTF